MVLLNPVRFNCIAGNFWKSSHKWRGRGKIEFPQGLKPSVYEVLSGTAEAVPFQTRFMRQALDWK